ncbi:MAG: alpha/beta fold hydrolase [Hyphomicrobiales bacterium]
MQRQELRVQIINVERNGYILHAEALAPASNASPWLVFGNSLITDLSIWDAQVNALAGQYGILRYDQAGHGQSGNPKGPIDFEVLGQDLLAVMDSAAIRQGIYVGLSMGVPTGLAAHSMAADRFLSLIFSDGQAKTAPGGAAGWAERIALARASGMRAFAEITADRWLTSTSGADKRARLTEMMSATAIDGFATCAAALQDYDYTQELERIACRTLLIAGAEDGAIPEGMANNLHPSIKGSAMHIIDGAGHVPCLEQPEAFNAIMRQFLEGFGEGDPA